MSIVIKVAWPCFLWGLGTALGELPPYFVARAAKEVRCHRVNTHSNQCELNNNHCFAASRIAPYAC
jgi:hypothetical protein